MAHRFKYNPRIACTVPLSRAAAPAMRVKHLKLPKLPRFRTGSDDDM
jgi:hypothetical protein